MAKQQHKTRSETIETAGECLARLFNQIVKMDDGEQNLLARSIDERLKTELEVATNKIQTELTVALSDLKFRRDLSAVQLDAYDKMVESRDMERRHKEEANRYLLERYKERDKALQDCESYCCTIDLLEQERSELKDELNELEDLTGDIKPDKDSDSGGTLVERVKALIYMATHKEEEVLRLHPIAASSRVIEWQKCEDDLATAIKQRDEAVQLLFDDKKIMQAKLDLVSKERDAWKASHDNQVKMKRELMDRPDLKDRAKSLEKLSAELATAKDELKNAIQRSRNSGDAYAALMSELHKARNALGVMYGTGERTVAEGIELLQSDFREEKHHVTKLIMDQGALTDELAASQQEVKKMQEAWAEIQTKTQIDNG